MGSIHEHMMLDLHFFGVPYGSTEYIHNILDHGSNVDIDYQRIFAVKHRHFMHNAESIRWIEANHGPFAALVAKLHVAYDIVSSREKREMNVGRSSRKSHETPHYKCEA